MDPYCREHGCYMFPPNSDEEAACRQRCRMMRKEPRVLASPAATAFLLLLEVIEIDTNPLDLGPHIKDQE